MGSAYKFKSVSKADVIGRRWEARLKNIMMNVRSNERGWESPRKPSGDN